jgi:probable HAF family extracellular repeat protein
MVAGLPVSARYGLAGFALVAAALLAIGVTGGRQPADRGDERVVAGAQPVTVRLPGARPTDGEAKPAAFFPIRLANGTTIQVPWTSGDATGDQTDPSRFLPAPRHRPYSSDDDWGADGGGASAAPVGFILFDRSATLGRPSGAARAKSEVTASARPQPKAASSKPAKPKKPEGAKADASAADQKAEATLTDLGTLGGDESVAYDLNERGRVVGKSQTASGEWHAFVWEDGSMRDLGSLGGESCACATNEKGEIAGYSYLKGSSGPCRAVRWSAEGEMTTLGWLKDWVEHRGGAITESGMVLGWAAGEDGSQSAALMWAKEKPVELSATSGSAAYDANLKGTIVGYEGRDGRRTAVTWRVGAKAKALPDLGSGWSEARAVNADGHVVGFRQPTGGRACAFVSRGDKLEELKNLDGYTMSVAQGINDSDQVVGYVWKGKDNDRTERAFVWRDRSMTDLNSLVSGGAVIQKARRINNHGQIAAAALIGGNAHACLIELG